MGVEDTVLSQSRNELLPTNHEVTVLGERDTVQMFTQINVKLQM